jgi:hypothetical protein
MPFHDTTPDRFWSKVRISSPNACWLWQASAHNSGYGQIRWGGTIVLAHRLAYELTYSRIPPGMFVCHHCDTKMCCNPHHLYVGTRQDNADDAVARGRIVSGEKHYHASLSDADVAFVRRRYAQGGIKQSDLAAMVGVSVRQIQRILAGEQR